MNFNSILRWIIVLMLWFLQRTNSSAQQIPDTAGSRIRFVPKTMYPSGSTARQVEPGFMLELKRDTLVSYLPYIGRAFHVPYGSTSGPLNVTLTGFGYTEQRNKKEELTIRIKPVSGGDIRELTLTLYKDGGAYLQVYFNQRQNIGFRGRLLRP